MSTLSYNGINLPYPFNTGFMQEVVYDDVGNTDWICTRFDISTQAIININYINLIAPQFSATFAPDNAATIMNAIRTLLLQPRKTLSYKCNGYDLIPQASAGPGTVDARNGPKPKSCVINQLTTETFLITYSIEASYWENNQINGSTLVTTNLPGNAVLFNRWDETVEIDNCMYSTRTRNGKFMIRSDNAEGFIADQVRSEMAVVGVPEGFLRQSSHYTVTPDGLAIQYRVTDKEVFKMPPSPAYEAEGHYSESCTHGGAIRYGDFRVRLKGCKDKNICPQDKLLEVAVGMGFTKLAVRGTNFNNGSILQHARIGVDLFNNIVEFDCRAMINQTTERVVSTGPQAGAGRGVAAFGPSNGFNFAVGLTYTPGSEDGTPAPLYRDRGTASLLLQAARYYDPSLRGTELAPGNISTFNNPTTTQDPPNSQLNRGLDIGTAGVNAES